MAFELAWVTLTKEPLAPAMGAPYLFWTPTTGNVARIKNDATELNESFLTAAGVPRIAADATYIYYTTTTGIGRAKHDGTENVASWLELGVEPFGLIVTGTTIYWSRGSNIGRATIAGASAEAEWVKVGSASEVRSLTQNGEHFYWTYSAGAEEHFLGRCSMTGTEVAKEWLNTEQFNFAIAANSAFIWLAPEPATYVSRVPTSGTGFVKEWLKDASEYGGFAWDSTYFYATRYTAKTIARMTLAEAGEGAKEGEKPVEKPKEEPKGEITVALSQHGMVPRPLK